MIKTKISANIFLKIIFWVLIVLAFIGYFATPAGVYQNYFGIGDFYKEYLYIYNVIGPIWVVGLLALAAAAVFTGLGLFLASFIGYCIYSVVFFYFIFNLYSITSSGISWFKTGAYMEIYLYVAITVVSIILFVLSVKKYKAVSGQEIIAPAVVTNADELLKYKQLLDAGALTQEEFDKKKNELLGL